MTETTVTESLGELLFPSAHSGVSRTSLSHGPPDFCFLEETSCKRQPLSSKDQPVEAILSASETPAPTMTLCSYGSKLTREELSRVETPAATATHKPIPHIPVVEKLIEAIGFRQIGVVREENAVSSDGMKVFVVMDLSSGFDGCQLAIGLRNSHDKSFRLSCTVGLRLWRARHKRSYAQQIFMRSKPAKMLAREAEGWWCSP